jgi:hypothetical protein
LNRFDARMKTNLTLVPLLAALLASATAQNKPAQPATTATTQLVGDFQKSAAASSDKTVQSLGGDLGATFGALTKSLGSNPELQGQLQGVLQSLMGDKGAATLGALQKLSQAKLTPQQTKLTKDVYNLGSAYVVQRNFGSLEGAQPEVAQVVTALRKGSYTETLGPLKKIGESANLTAPQKELLSSLTEQYAPGLKKAAGTLKGVPGLSKPAPATPQK